MSRSKGEQLVSCFWRLESYYLPAELILAVFTSWSLDLRDWADDRPPNDVFCCLLYFCEFLILLL